MSGYRRGMASTMISISLGGLVGLREKAKMDRLVFVVLCFFLSVPLLADAGFVSAKSGLNIRDKANSQAKIVGLAPFQAQLEIEEVTSAKEKVGGVEAPWMKVTYFNPETNSSVEGYAFGGYIFTEKGTETTALREKFICRTHNLVLKHEKKDDKNWKVSLKLKNGSTAVIFQNNGNEEKGPDDLYPSEFYPETSYILFRHSGMPDSYLVDYTTGKVQNLEYGAPVFSHKGTALFDITVGGMYGVNVIIYELKGRAAVKAFSLDDAAAGDWEGFRCSWKDESSLDCRYGKGSGEKKFQIRKSGAKWARSGG